MVGDLGDHHLGVVGLAGAVRADVTMPDLLMLLKGLMRSLQDVPPGAAGDAQRDRVIAVVMDGLRRPAVPGHGA